jgi:hypothetical protein
MSNARKCLAESRAIITSTCAILQEAQQGTVTFGPEMYASSADCYVLLHDATKLFCRAVSQIHGEQETHSRWSPDVPGLFLCHPDKCEDALAWLERIELQQVSVAASGFEMWDLAKPTVPAS